MSDNRIDTLYYVHDPMCSWCWGFRSELLKLKQALPAGIQLVSLVGGLATDSDDPMPEALQQQIQGAWKRIQQVIPGTQFNFSFWSENIPRRSTYPACRAVIAADQLAASADQMTYAIQQAYYLQARNPSDLETLVEIAASIGLEANEFKQLMQSSQLQQALESELEQVRSLHVYSFPSLVLQLDKETFPVQLDYNSADIILKDIVSLQSRHIA